MQSGRDLGRRSREDPLLQGRMMNLLRLDIESSDIFELGKQKDMVRSDRVRRIAESVEQIIGENPE